MGRPRQIATPDNFILAQWGVPVVIPGSGSITTGGAITITAPLSQAYTGGVWLWLPGNTIVGQATGGLWYTVMSTTQTGQVSTNFVDASTTAFIPYIPTSIPNAVGNGNPLAITQTVNTDLYLANLTLPGGSLGINGVLECSNSWTLTTSANNKTPKVWFGGTAIRAQVLTTAAGMNDYFILRNRALTNLQVITPGGASATIFGSSAGVGSSVSTIDTTADVNILISGRIALAAEYCALEGAYFMFKPR